MFAPLFGAGDFVFNCAWKTLVGYDICQNGGNIRYILNFISPKICVDFNRLPVELKSRLVKIDNHMKKKKKKKSTKRICARLDNPDKFDVLKNVNILGDI